MAFADYARTGDVEALALVFDACAPRLLSVAVGLSHSPGDAEDLVQETFLVAMESAAAYRPDLPLMPWLGAILANRARAARRLLRRQTSVGVPREVRRGPEDAALDREASQEIASGIEKLAQPHREVVILHVQHGLSPHQIARALSRSGGTVRSQLARGLAQLRQKLPEGLAMAVVALRVNGLGEARSTVLAAAQKPPLSLAASVSTGILMTKSIVLLSAALLITALWVWSVVGTSPEISTDTVQRRAPQRAEVLDDERPHTGPLARRSLTQAESRPSLRARLVDLTGSPVPDVEVGFVARRASDRGGVPRLVLPEGSPRTRSGPSGDLRLELPVGTPGFLVLAEIGLVFRDRADMQWPFHGITEDLDLGELVVGRAPVLRGRVRSVDGLDLAAARVCCLPAGRPDSGQRARYVRVTDASGRFEFDDVGAGAFVLTVNRGGYRAALHSVFLGLGAVKTQDVVLKSGFALSGRVVDDLGRPVADARVLPIREAQIGVMRVQAPTEVEAVVTGPNGSFRLEGLRRDETGVRVSAVGHQRTRHADVRSENQIVLTRSGVLHGRVVDPTQRPVKEVVVQIESSEGAFEPSSARTDRFGRFSMAHAPGVVRLRVGGRTTEPYSVQPGQSVDVGSLVVPTRIRVGVVVSDGTHPVVGAKVAAHAVGVRGGPALASGVTDVQGMAWLRGLRAGAYSLRVRHYAFVAAERDCVVRPAMTAASRIVLSRGAVVRAVVKRGDGTPAQGREVHLVRASGDGESRANQSVKTGLDGVARFRSLAPGNYDLVVRAGLAKWEAFGSVVQIGEAAAALTRKRIVVNAADLRVDLPLPVAGSIRGRVVQGGNPAPGARVTLACGEDLGGGGFDELRTTYSGEDGAFRFLDVPFGRHLLVFGVHGAVVPSQSWVEVRDQAPVSVTCRWQEAPLQLRVVQAGTGIPIADAEVEIRAATGLCLRGPKVLTRVGGFLGQVEVMESIGALRSDPAGWVRIDSIPVGHYQAKVRGFGSYLDRDLEFSVPEAGRNLGLVSLRSGARISGVVRDAKGRVVAHAQMYRRSVGSPKPPWRPFVTRNGVFSLENLEPGTYEIRAAVPAPGDPTEFGATVRVEVGAGESRSVVVPL